MDLLLLLYIVVGFENKGGLLKNFLLLYIYIRILSAHREANSLYIGVLFFVGINKTFYEGEINLL